MKFAYLAILAAVATTTCSAAKEDKELLTEAPTPAPGTAAAELAKPAPDVSKLPAGAYKTDPSHTSLTFQVNHLGFSTYTAGFDKVEADLTIDPKDPATATLKASIPLVSLDLPAPPKGFVEELTGPNFLNAAKTPVMTFLSTTVKVTGPAEADVTGDLTLNGVTKPVTMSVAYNGGWEGIPPDPFARIGFSAHGVLKRSEFGIAYGIPSAGNPMGVGDEVKFAIETEMVGPAWKDAPKAPATPGQ